MRQRKSQDTSTLDWVEGNRKSEIDYTFTMQSEKQIGVGWIGRLGLEWPENLLLPNFRPEKSGADDSHPGRG